MVPSDDLFRTTCLLQHVEHHLLEDVVDGLDRDSRTRLWHGEDIGDLHSVLVNELSEHETHNFHRYTGTAVF